MRRRTMRLGVFLFIFISTGAITLTRVNAKPAGIYEDEIFLPEEIFGVKKREDSSRVYLEQCGIVEFPNVRRGVVNVLAFLDSSWPYSHRQAIMLEMLSSRLRKSGLTKILFFVVNVSPDFPRKMDSTEDDIEREAWLGVSPDEIAGFAKINKTLDSLTRIMDPDIELIQDNEELGIWKLLGGSRDQVLVIDRCGKLTYQVIVPWSILHFPYVKAAILSTYNDQPCEVCDSIEEDILEETSQSTRTMGSFVDAVESSTETESLFAENFMSTSRFSPNSERAIVADSTTRNPFDENFYARTEQPGNNEETTTETPEIQDDVTTILPEVESSNSDEDPSRISTSTFNYESTIFEENHHLPATEMTIGSFDSDSDNESYDTTRVNAVTSVDTTMANVDSTTTEVIFESTKEPRFDEESATKIETLTRNSATNFDAGDESLSTTSKFEATDSKEEDNVVSTTENFSETSTPEILSSEEKYQRSDDLSPRLENPKESEANGLDSSYVPIRIIMHAPHFHVDTDSTRMHEYLVMKTGSSETHGHLASQDATRLYRGPQDHQEVRMADSAAEAIERKAWSMKNLIFTKDESTGLFGEVADYWRDLSSLENYDELEETERPENQRIYEEVIKESTNEKLWDESATSNGENWKSATESLAAEAASEIITEVQPITRTEEFDSEEDETRNKLIAHYSKLLPWIYYVLDK